MSVILFEISKKKLAAIAGLTGLAGATYLSYKHGEDLLDSPIANKYTTIPEKINLGLTDYLAKAKFKDKADVELQKAKIYGKSISRAVIDHYSNLFNQNTTDKLDKTSNTIRNQPWYKLYKQRLAKEREDLINSAR